MRVAEQTHRCAPVVVVADDDPWVASLAAAVAQAADAPLLLADAASPEALAATLSRLDVEELVTVGLEFAAFGLPGTELLAPDDLPDPASDEVSDTPDAGSDTDEREPPAAGADHLRLAVWVADHLGTDRFLAVANEDAEARAAALTRMTPDLALLPLPDDLETVVTGLPAGARLKVLAGDRDARATADRLLGLGLDAAVAAEGDDPWARAMSAAVAAAGRTEGLLPVDGQDLRADRERTVSGPTGSAARCPVAPCWSARSPTTRTGSSPPCSRGSRCPAVGSACSRTSGWSRCTARSRPRSSGHSVSRGWTPRSNASARWPSRTEPTAHGSCPPSRSSRPSPAPPRNRPATTAAGPRSTCFGRGSIVPLRRTSTCCSTSNRAAPTS